MKYTLEIKRINEQIRFQNEIEDFVFLQNGDRYTFFNIKGCDLLKEQENLDYTLIQDIDIFVFQTVDEYSVAITNLILERFPNKNIFFLDATASLIWEKKQIECILNEDFNLNNIQGRFMYIFSIMDEDRYVNVGKSALIYSSLQVMQSLCWARKRNSLGEKNPDKVILLIEFSSKNAGMGDLVISAQQYIRLAFQRGWYPVVNLTEDNQYISHEGDNMWDYYFEQPSLFSVEEALQSKNVIRGSENNFGILPWVGNPICNMNDAVKQKVKLKSSIVNYFEENISGHFFQNKQILGVIARGTDLAQSTHLKIDIYKMLEEIKQVLAEGGYDYIFLATEDEGYFELFKYVFGNKLIYVGQKRIIHNYEIEEYKYVGDLLDMKKENRSLWGRQYLMITYCLSKCNALLYSIPCGALRLANILKEKEFNFVRCTYNSVSSLRKKRNTIHISDCEEFFQNNKFIILYGIGDVAQMIYPIVKKYQDKIIPCDKRALYEKYDYLDINVISPDELKNHLKDAKILITSPRCGDEIQKELLDMGIDKNIIVKLDY